MKTLSAHDKQNLLRAIEKAGAYAADGDSPDDAIVKSASEFQVRPGHVGLMVNAYNTGQTTATRQNGDNRHEKAAEFAMADHSAIMERLYPTNVKTAAAVQRSTAIDPAYSMGPAEWMKREKVAGNLAKTLPPMRDRHTDEVYEKTAEAYPTDPNERMKKAFNATQDKRRDVEEARRVKSAAYDKLRGTFHELREYFATPGTQAFGDVKEAAALYFGADGSTVCRMLAQEQPALEKQAAVGAYTDMMSAPFDKIAQVIRQTQEYQNAAAAHEKLASASDEFTAETLRPFVQRPGDSVLGEPSSKQAVAGPWLGMGLGLNMLRNVAGRAKAPDEDPEIQQYVSEATDPAHESQLRQIKAQAMLNSLMSEDNVLSQAEPYDVLEAYNDIVTVSPRAADNRLLMQTMLRKRLEMEALDPMDIDQLLGIEDKLKKRDEGIRPDPEPRPKPAGRPGQPALPGPQKASPSVIGDQAKQLIEGGLGGALRSGPMGGAPQPWSPEPSDVDKRVADRAREFDLLSDASKARQLSPPTRL
jgi:hypothetical protein